jgi:hypothetical protein
MADALDRVVSRIGGAPTLDALSEVPGADLTTLLLEAFRRRAGRLTAADLLRRYRTDRFVTPATTPFHRLRAAEDRLVVEALRHRFELITLAPVTPLGTHSVVATVDQNKVVATIRGSEVAADPTNALALEAAVRRARLTDPTEPVRLAAIQRVVRAQRFEGPGGFAHFTLFGAVTAGRDTGDLAFERRHAAEHVALAAGTLDAEVRLTVLDQRYEPVADAVRAACRHSAADVVDDPERQTGRGYYTGFCFKVFVAGTELADGGFVDWTQRLLGNRKERLMISGVGLDRLAGTLAG